MPWPTVPDPRKAWSKRPTIDIPTVSKSIMVYCSTKKLTQKQFAERSGISIATLTRIYAGYPCNLGTVSKIADTLQVDMSSLLFKNPEAASEKSQMIKFYHRFKALERLPLEVQDLLVFLVMKILDSK